MNKQTFALLLIGVLLWLLVIEVNANQTGILTLPWSTVDGGAPETIQGGFYQLRGTIGQADAGVLSGGLYTLHGGYWQPNAASIPTSIGLLDFVSSSGSPNLFAFFLCGLGIITLVLLRRRSISSL